MNPSTKPSRHNRISDPSISDDEALNPKYTHLLNWLFWEEAPKQQSSLIRLKVMGPPPAIIKEKPHDDPHLENLRPVSLNFTMSARYKSNKILKNLTIQIPEENLVKSAPFVFKEEGLLLKNQVNIEEILDLIEGKEGRTCAKPPPSSSLHRRSLSEKRLSCDSFFDLNRFKNLLKSLKSASAIDLIEVLKVIQHEMYQISGKACYEVLILLNILSTPYYSIFSNYLSFPTI